MRSSVEAKAVMHSSSLGDSGGDIVTGLRLGISDRVIHSGDASPTVEVESTGGVIDTGRRWGSSEMVIQSGETGGGGIDTGRLSGFLSSCSSHVDQATYFGESNVGVTGSRKSSSATSELVS